jgi:hypothetical protein
MLPFTVVLAAAAGLVVAFTKRNRFDASARRVDAPLAEWEASRARLKAAAREVDNSTVAVEVALQPLMAAI